MLKAFNVVRAKYACKIVIKSNRAWIRNHYHIFTDRVARIVMYGRISPSSHTFDDVTRIDWLDCVTIVITCPWTPHPLQPNWISVFAEIRLKR